MACRLTANWKATSMNATFKNISRPQRRICCREYIGLFRCSSGGCWARTKGPLPTSTSKTTSTNSRFASIAAVPPRGENCFIGWPSRPFRYRQQPLPPSQTARYSGGWSHVNSPEDQSTTDYQLSTDAHDYPITTAPGHVAVQHNLKLGILISQSLPPGPVVTLRHHR